NVARASNGTVTSPPDSETVKATQTPHLSLTKGANPTTYDHVGQAISYTLVATNDGNVTLSGVSISDPTLGSLVCSGSTTLAPGGSLTCTASYTIKQSDLDAGSVHNHATATNGNGVNAEADASVNAVQTKSLSLTKTAAPLTYSAVGQAITYTYVLKNTGNVTLAGPFSVTDDKQGVINPCGSGPLAPNASTSCTSTHTITQADLVTGSITNKATASGNGT